MTDHVLSQAIVTGDEHGVSIARLTVVRIYYLLDFVLLGLYVWPKIIAGAGDWQPLDSVAFSFWAAVSLLSGLGLRYPIAMLPLLLVQLFYKSVWLLAIALPMWLAGQLAQIQEMTRDMIFALVLLIAVIPWRYVVAKFVKRPGEPWRRRGTSAA